MHALVAGGAGSLGQHLIPKLTAQGWQVTVIDRCDESEFLSLPDGVMVWHADVRDLNRDTMVAAAFDVLVDCVGRTAPRPGAALLDAIEVTAHLVRLAVLGHVGRYVSVAHYPKTDADRITAELLWLVEHETALKATVVQPPPDPLAVLAPAEIAAKIATDLLVLYPNAGEVAA